MYYLLSLILHFMKKTLHQALVMCCSLVITSAVLTGCNKDKEEAPPPRPTDDVVDILANTEGLDSLNDVVENLGDLKSLLQSGNYTVFAPNNEAFEKFVASTGFLSIYDIDPSYVQDVILYHLIPNSLYNANQLDSTVSGLLTLDKLTFTQGDSILINEATQPNPTTIVSKDIQAANGVVHVINEVLLPPSLRQLRPYFGSVIGVTALYLYRTQNSAYTLSPITQVLFTAGLSETLNGSDNYTVLAPLDAASNFNPNTNPQVAAQIANRHLLQGKVNLAEAGRIVTTLSKDTVYVTNYQGDVYLNGNYAVNTDVPASNGNVYALFATLQPPVALENAILEAELVSGNTFNIFKTALKETGLQLGKGKTIFVPSDSAFAAAGLVPSIDSMTTTARIDPALLSNILQTHVINGLQFRVDIQAAGDQTVNALNQTALTFKVTPQSATISSPNTTDAGFVYTDVLSQHGAVHFINKVLTP